MEMRAIPILRLLVIVTAALLALSSVFLLSHWIGTGEYPPLEFVLMYGAVPVIASAVCLLLGRSGKWLITSLWIVFISITTTATWEVWNWCTPWKCGERDFWGIVRVQVVMNPLVVLAFVLVLLAQAQHMLRTRFAAKLDGSSAK